MLKPYWQTDLGKLYCGDVLECLAQMPDESVHVCVTSPPYWGLRDYGVEDQLGLEKSPQEYVAKMVEVFGQVRRVLRSDGVCFLNIGDSYNNNNGFSRNKKGESSWFREGRIGGASDKKALKHSEIKIKDLCLVPERLAIALQDDGWWVRSRIAWCLSGGAWVYARTQKGDMPVMVKDLSRLDPSTVKLWNGEKWTQLLGMSKTSRTGNEIELLLRSGERVSCTPNHKFPTNRGLLGVSEIQVGDVIQHTILPEPENPMDSEYVNTDAAYLAGLYLGEGSMSGDTIQIAGSIKEKVRWDTLQEIARKYGGSATRTIDGNKMFIRLYGKLLVAIIRQFVSGKTAKDKCLAPVCWRYSNKFLFSILNGYLHGDGHWDEKNGRWRIAFTRNYNLERDIRLLSARLNCRLTLNACKVKGFDKEWPAFKGELRYSGLWAQAGEVMEIRKSKCRYVYDLGVEDEPHLYALASGLLTHNSKRNPMPESVTDRPTSAWEHIWMLTKSATYYYDAEAVKEPVAPSTVGRGPVDFGGAKGREYTPDKSDPNFRNGTEQWGRTFDYRESCANGRNQRNVWNLAT